MVARHCVTCVGCTAYSLASCETVLSPTRASNPTLALKAALCRLRFAFISLLFLIYSRLTKVYLNQWSSFWGPPLSSRRQYASARLLPYRISPLFGLCKQP